MGVVDYVAGLGRGEPGAGLRVERLRDTPWEPSLRHVMAERGVALFEESLLDDLLVDITESAAAAAWFSMSPAEQRRTPPPPLLQATFERARDSAIHADVAAVPPS